MSAMFKFVALLALAAAASSQVRPGSSPTLAFEAASVKEVLRRDQRKIISGEQRVGMKVDGDRVEISTMTLADLINIAFQTKPYQVKGAEWLTLGLHVRPDPSDCFDIHAKLPVGSTEKQVPEMLQTLLVERFKLKFHRENSEQPAYGLVVQADGLKMKASPPDAVPEESRRNENITEVGGHEGERISMSELADLLSRLVDRPVLDMTGLMGKYQLSVDLAMAARMDEPWTPTQYQTRTYYVGAYSDSPTPPALPTVAPQGGSLLGGVQKLGLKLESRQSRIEKLVIEHLERTPSADLPQVVQDLLPLAKQGDARAQFSLGLIYNLGRGVQQNANEAARWYRLAAAQGHPAAQYNLGIMFDQGRGVSVDTEGAVRWYRLAAEQGFVLAQFNLGKAYAEGRGGLRRDYIQAYMWLTLAGASADADVSAMSMNSRDAFAWVMRKGQIAEAQRRARAWTTKVGTPP